MPYELAAQVEEEEQLEIEGQGLRVPLLSASSSTTASDSNTALLLPTATAKKLAAEHASDAEDDLEYGPEDDDIDDLAVDASGASSSAANASEAHERQAEAHKIRAIKDRIQRRMAHGGSGGGAPLAEAVASVTAATPQDGESDSSSPAR